MGRSLQNTMINLGIQGACDEAMYQASYTIFYKIVCTNTNVSYNVFYNKILRCFVFCKIEKYWE